MKFEVTKRLIIDPIQIAVTIEMVMEQYMRKIQYKAGAYIEGCDIPLITFDRRCYRRESDKNGKIVLVPIMQFEDIRGTIFNDNHDVIQLPRRLSDLIPEPTMPIRGMRIIQIYIDKLLTENSAWNGCGSPTLQMIWGEFISQEYYYTMEVYEKIESILTDIRIDVLDFIGRNKWLMNFQSTRGCDIIIEQTIDYRIHQWCLEHNQEI
ncbi:MAG: hypothetical protein ACD_84C00034G0001 [uncultured bacterium]|nr:MAG: hypothetical protein ACD_84C00034G0001 [uncultured bacterium]